VVDFANTSAWTYWGPQLGAAAAAEFATQLVKSEEFTVIERQQLNAILAEQELSLSGVIDPSTVGEIGRLLGVQAILTGAVTQFSVKKTRVGVGPAAVEYNEAESKIDLRIVSTMTGEILMVDESSGKKRFGGVSFEDFDFHQDVDIGVAQEALRPAVENAVEHILEEKATLDALSAVVAGGEIVGSGEEGSVYIDRGENFGVEVGQQYDVYRVVEEIRDGAGNLLDALKKKVGVIEVTRVLSRSSICQVVEGEVKEGDAVSPRG
jgi:curli biogenesis system outer membrane secretion channel CsgG